jgi:hypothetical protein
VVTPAAVVGDDVGAAVVGVVGAVVTTVVLAAAVDVVAVLSELLLHAPRTSTATRSGLIEPS